MNDASLGPAASNRHRERQLDELDAMCSAIDQPTTLRLKQSSTDARC